MLTVCYNEFGGSCLNTAFVVVFENGRWNLSLLEFCFCSELVTCYSMQVRKRPLNKKETAKHEEDIIDTVSNSLTVHETKLKVSVVGNGIPGY